MRTSVVFSAAEYPFQKRIADKKRGFAEGMSTRWQRFESGGQGMVDGMLGGRRRGRMFLKADDGTRKNLSS